MAARRWSQIVSERRRGPGHAVPFLALALSLVLALGGCGGSGEGALTDEDKAADTALLNGMLAQELVLIDAYERGLPRLRGRTLALAQQLRGQGQAHVDALTKAIRGLGGETEAAEAAPEPAAPRGRTEALALAYEEENAALSLAMDAVPRLSTAAPRTLAAALSASHAQHLTLLRQSLGTGLAASAPEPFEPGDLPPPAPRPPKAG